MSHARTVGTPPAPDLARGRGPVAWFSDRSVRTRILSAIGLLAVVSAGLRRS